MVSLPARDQTAALRLRARLVMPSARWVTCVVLLLAAAAGMRVLSGWFGFVLQKEAVWLKKPLREFDARKLRPRYQRHPATDRIRSLSADQLESLGTGEYLQVYLTDTQKPAPDPTRVAHLFVTYYTGQPDMVPHVPEECYLAGGYDRVGLPTTKTVSVRGIGAPGDQVPVRVIQFRAPQQRRVFADGSDVTTVMYLFHTNGRYATTRNVVRVILSNPFQRYAYYAKIEVSFTNDKLSSSAGAEAAVAALGPLLEAVMPRLLEDHIDLAEFAPRGADEPARK